MDVAVLAKDWDATNSRVCELETRLDTAPHEAGGPMETAMNEGLEKLHDLEALLIEARARTLDDVSAKLRVALAAAQRVAGSAELGRSWAIVASALPADG